MKLNSVLNAFSCLTGSIGELTEEPAWWSCWSPPHAHTQPLGWAAHPGQEKPLYLQCRDCSMKGLGAWALLSLPAGCPAVVMKAAVLCWVLQHVLDSKWHPKPVVLANGIQIDRSAAKSMLGMETSSRPFNLGDSGAKSRSPVCNKAMTLHNSVADTFGHNEQV